VSESNTEPHATWERHHLTDLGNAERLLRQHGRNIRYCSLWGKWLVWDGARWSPDEIGQVEHYAKQTVRSIYGEAEQINDSDARHRTAQWARRSESQARISAMLLLAQTEPGVAVSPNELDADPWLLNCLNGTIDLRTGQLQPHRRQDLITKLVPTEYHYGATHLTWERFLREATGDDAEMIAFLQRAVGYSLTGDTSQEVLFFVHGPAATGKSTFIEAVKRTIGDYARTADFGTFLKRRDNSGPRNDIARLAGARLVASNEVDRGERLAEGLVKTVTGGDILTARFLYHEGFEFVATFKLWLVANHQPVVDDDDDAMWRRILRVPFDNTIPEERRDPQMKKTLCDPGDAGLAILAWAVQGCLSWQREGLGVPPSVRRATEEYRQEMDPLQDFIAAHCTLGRGSWTSSAELRGAYQAWARETGQQRLLTDKELTVRLRARGCEREKRGGVRGWRGIGLVAMFEPDPMAA